MNARIPATNLGFPRIGVRRELKWAVDRYWSNDIDQVELLTRSANIRRWNWNRQKELGIDHIPSNDFSFYDHVLDTAAMVGTIPERFRNDAGELDLDAYFSVARGRTKGNNPLAALEMTKWFDTNYHYIVPEIAQGQQFQFENRKVVDEFLEALELGITTRPVLVGPISFLVLARQRGADAASGGNLSRLVAVYEEILSRLGEAGAEWLQIDEPALGLDLDRDYLEAYAPTYNRLAQVDPRLRLLIVTYFTGLRKNLPTALSLPVAGLHLDLVAEPAQLDRALDEAPESLSLSLGVTDGRNIWRSDLDGALLLLEKARTRLGAERILVAPSCSLLHLPVDLDAETNLDPELRGWLCFAIQRLEETALLTRGLNEGRSVIDGQLEASKQKLLDKSRSPSAHDKAVEKRVADLGVAHSQRSASFEERRKAQAQRLGLPILPTTTIGSFPQTPELRALRSRYRRGEITADAYESEIRGFIERSIRLQEEIGLDVLVHGEFERTDMVEYFAQYLRGFVFTEFGWVQSYGSRCVKPPIIFGDVSRPQPITTEWSSYAQSLTDRPVKAMLTGPITMIAWSFVRTDQPLEHTAREIALAIRDEVADLEREGIAIIQIDEPGLRELLPLHREDQPEYLAWAVDAFRLSSSGVSDATQIHTHMCYADFDDIMQSVIDFDADVISFEASRSNLALVNALRDSHYPNEIGPGIWDVHSPRVPDVDELEERLVQALSIFPPGKNWVNPDCGLKTRKWEEVEPSLRNLVAATKRVRERSK